MQKYVFTLVIVTAITLGIFYVFSQRNYISKRTFFNPTLSVTDAVEKFEHPLSIEVLRKRNYTGTSLAREALIVQTGVYTKYLVSYLSDGLKIYGVMAVPQGNNGDKFPAIVFNHGYIPPEQYINTEKYVAYIDTFARAGYVVLMPDYRGHGISQGEAEGGYFSPGYTIDSLYAYEALKKDPAVDSRRIGMWGHSMGGYVTLRALAIKPEIKTAVIWAGVVGRYEDIFRLFFRRPTREGTAQQQNRWRTSRSKIVQMYGEPHDTSEFWKSVDAINYISPDQRFQVHHGVIDSTVNVAISRVFHEYLRGRTIFSEYFEYPYEDHNINGPSFGTAMQRAIDFYNANL